MLSFFVSAALSGCVFAVLVWGAKAVVRRYQRCTFLDSNAPTGRYVDWSLFWGRRSR